MQETTTALKLEAKRLGFDLAAVSPAVSAPGVGRFREWLDAGFAGEMAYLHERAEAYEHPRHVLSEVRSILMLAVNYRTADARTPSPGEGRISRYAWGMRDYHDVIRDNLHQLADYLRDLVPGSQARGVIDTAPLLEREYAQLAGLGWIGKNTLLLNKQFGSLFFLAAILTDVELVADEPHAANHCGTCRACLDACPTDAFVDAYVLDARKCISYTTIEQRGLPEAELRTGQGDWLFGCDVCQDVCPWNRKVPISSEPAFAPIDDTNPIDLIALLSLDDAGFRRRFRKTPLWRPKRSGILSSAAIVLGNQRYLKATDTLIAGLHDPEEQIRMACAWALGQFQTDEAAKALRDRANTEEIAPVRCEIEEALRDRRS